MSSVQDESKRLKKVYFKSQLKPVQEKRREAAIRKKRWKWRLLYIMVIILLGLLSTFLASLKTR